MHRRHSACARRMPRVAANTIPMINPASMASRRTIIKAPAMQIPLCFQAWDSSNLADACFKAPRWRGPGGVKFKLLSAKALHHHGLTS